MDSLGVSRFFATITHLVSEPLTIDDSFISFWAINQIALSNWQLGGSLVATGISVWQAVVAIIVGKVIIALVAIANGYVGAKWHMYVKRGYG
jgi:purine-cytosine permease-like protein